MVSDQRERTVRWVTRGSDGWGESLSDYELELQVDARFGHSAPLMEFHQDNAVEEWGRLLRAEQVKWGFKRSRPLAFDWNGQVTAFGSLPVAVDPSGGDWPHGADLTDALLANAFRICESAGTEVFSQGEPLEGTRRWAARVFGIYDSETLFLPPGIIGYDRAVWREVRRAEAQWESFRRTYGKLILQELENDLKRFLRERLWPSSPDDWNFGEGEVNFELSQTVLSQTLLLLFVTSQDIESALDYGEMWRTSAQDLDTCRGPGWMTTSVRSIQKVRQQLFEWVEGRMAVCANSLEFLIRFGPRPCQVCERPISQLRRQERVEATEPGGHGLLCSYCASLQQRDWLDEVHEAQRIRDRRINKINLEPQLRDDED